MTLGKWKTIRILHVLVLLFVLFSFSFGFLVLANDAHAQTYEKTADCNNWGVISGPCNVPGPSLCTPPLNPPDDGIVASTPIGNDTGISCASVGEVCQVGTCWSDAGGPVCVGGVIECVASGPSAPSVTILANGSNPLSVTQGTSVTLAWTVTGATSCTASGDWSGSKTSSGVGGEAQGVLGAGTYSYSISCTGPGGTASDSVVVTVSGGGTMLHATTPTIFTEGGSVTFNWSCPAVHSDGGFLLRDGTQVADAADGPFTDTPPSSGSYLYTLECYRNNPAFETNAWGSVPVTVNAAAGPPQLQVTPNPHNFGSVPVGSPVTQVFNVRNIGGTPLTGVLTNLSGAFECASTDCSYTLNPGEAQGIEIRYTPPDSNSHSITAEFTSSSGSSGTWALSESSNCGPDPWICATTVCSTGSIANNPPTHACNPAPPVPGDRCHLPGGGIAPVNAELWVCVGATPSSSVFVPLSGNGTVSAPPVPTVDLSPPSATITAGNAISLTWTSVGADPNGCTITASTGPGPYTNYPANGSLTVTPNVDTTYTLRCSNSSGTSLPDSSLIIVNTPTPPPVINSFTATPVVDYSNSSSLNWNVSGPAGTVCSSSGPGWNGAAALVGSDASAPLSTNGTFVLTCSNAGGTVSETRTTYVRPRVSVWNTNFPSPLQYDTDTTEVRWNVLGPATSCTASGYGPWNGAKNPGGGVNQGPEVHGPFTSNTTFTLTCQNANGNTGTDDFTVELYPKINLFNVVDEVVQGTNTTIEWDVGGPNLTVIGVTLSGDDGTGGSRWSGGKSPSGTQDVGPVTVDSEYQIVAENPVGISVQERRTVRVLVPTAGMIVLPSQQVLKGKSATLEWQTEYIAPGTCRITEPSSGLSVSVADSGTYDTGPITEQVDFTLTCDLQAVSGGTIEATATVVPFIPTFEEE